MHEKTLRIYSLTCKKLTKGSWPKAPLAPITMLYTAIYTNVSHLSMSLPYKCMCLTQSTSH